MQSLLSWSPDGSHLAPLTIMPPVSSICGFCRSTFRARTHPSRLHRAFGLELVVPQPPL